MYKKPTKARAFDLIVVGLTLYIFGALAALSWNFVLPAKFFYDSEYIRNILSDASYLMNDDPFRTTAFVYKSLGFSASTPREVAAVVFFTLSFIPLLISYAMGARNCNYTSLILLSAWVGVSSIYLSQYSKELIAIWFVFIALYCLGLRRPLAWMAFVVVAIYGVFFRSYWIIIAGFWIVLVWLSYRPWNFYVKLTFLLVVMLLVSVIFFESFGYHITEVRDRVNEYRLNSVDATTMIRNYFPSITVFHDLLNWLIAWFFILIPLPALLLFELQYTVFFAMILFSLLIAYRAGNVLEKYKRFLLPSEERRIRGSITFMIAFTLVQGIFEPDYGSVLKHLTNLLPVLAYVLAYGLHTVRSSKYSG